MNMYIYICCWKAGYLLYKPYKSQVFAGFYLKLKSVLDVRFFKTRKMLIAHEKKLYLRLKTTIHNNKPKLTKKQTVNKKILERKLKKKHLLQSRELLLEI